MNVTIGDRKVDVLDALCAFRRCLRVGEWKGNLVPGVGYHYAPRSQWYFCCFHRAASGCPHPLPEPDPEKARCCYSPSVHAPSKAKGQALPSKQRCKTCGAWLKGFALEAVRACRLPEMPKPSPCDHSMADRSWGRPGWWECPSFRGGCRGAWDHRPRAHELPQADFSDLYKDSF